MFYIHLLKFYEKTALKFSVGVLKLWKTCILSSTFYQIINYNDFFVILWESCLRGFCLCSRSLKKCWFSPTLNLKTGASLQMSNLSQIMRFLHQIPQSHYSLRLQNTINMTPLMVKLQHDPLRLKALKSLCDVCIKATHTLHLLMTQTIQKAWCWAGSAPSWSTGWRKHEQKKKRIPYKPKYFLKKLTNCFDCADNQRWRSSLLSLKLKMLWTTEQRL